MSWRDRGKEIPERIRHEELQRRMEEEKRQKEAEAATKSFERVVREFYPRVKEVCTVLTTNIKGKLESSPTSFRIIPPQLHLFSDLEKKDPSYRIVKVSLWGVGVVVSIRWFTKPFFAKANKSGSIYDFSKGEGYYRGLESSGETKDWGVVSYFILYDDFSEEKLAEKLEEFIKEVLKKEADTELRWPSEWEGYIYD